MQPYASIGGEPILDDEMLVRLTLGQPKESDIDGNMQNQRGDYEFGPDFMKSLHSMKNVFAASSRSALQKKDAKSRVKGAVPASTMQRREKDREKGKRPQYDPNQLKTRLASGRRSVKSVSCLGKSWFDLMESEKELDQSQIFDKSRVSSASSSIYGRKNVKKASRPESEMRDLSDSEVSYIEELDFDSSVLFSKENNVGNERLVPIGEVNGGKKRATFSANLTKRYMRASTAKSTLGGMNTAANTTALSNYMDEDVDYSDNSDDDGSFDEGEISIVDQTSMIDLNSTAGLPEFRETASVVKKPKSGLVFRAFTPSLNINQKMNEHTALTIGRRDCETGPFTIEERNEVLYRQLCVLLWIFNNLTVEPNFKYTQIATCFSQVNPGGRKIPRSKILKEKAAEKQWERTILDIKPRAKKATMFGLKSALASNIKSESGAKNQSESHIGTIASRPFSASSQNSSNVSFAEKSSVRSRRSLSSAATNEVKHESILDKIGLTEAIVEEIGEDDFDSLASRPHSRSSVHTVDKSQICSRPQSSSAGIKDSNNTLHIPAPLFVSSAESTVRRPLDHLTEDEHEQDEADISGSYIIGGFQDVPGTANTVDTTDDDPTKADSRKDDTQNDIDAVDGGSPQEVKRESEGVEAETALGNVEEASHFELEKKKKVKSTKKVEFTPNDPEDGFSSSVLAENASEVPIRMRSFWNQIKLEQGLQMRDVLAQHSRVRKNVSKAKLNAIGQSLNARKSTNIELYAALKQVRESANEIYKQDREAQEQYVDWYLALLANLPSSFGSKRLGSSGATGSCSELVMKSVPAHHDRILARFEELGRVGAVPSRLITGAALRRFLLDEAKLRSWELCDPNVRPAIDFFCEHVANLPKTEFLDWLAAYSPHFAALESYTMCKMKEEVDKKQKAQIRTN